MKYDAPLRRRPVMSTRFCNNNRPPALPTRNRREAAEREGGRRDEPAAGGAPPRPHAKLKPASAGSGERGEKDQDVANPSQNKHKPLEVRPTAGDWGGEGAAFSAIPAAQCATRRHIHGRDRETEGEAGAGEKETLKGLERGAHWRGEQVDVSLSCPTGKKNMFPLSRGSLISNQRPIERDFFSLPLSLSLSFWLSLPHPPPPHPTSTPPFRLYPFPLFSEHLALHSG